MVSAAIDRTDDSNRRSWVPGADGHAVFPVQNLPLGVFSPADREPRAGIAIGDNILDLPAVLAAGLLSGAAAGAVEAARGDKLNELLALGAGPRRALRERVGEMLGAEYGDAGAVAAHLHRASDCALLLPATIGDFTDFYAGIHHAEAVGRLFRPDHPLLPNYKHVPVGYHGRASSVRPSGVTVRRPSGQTLPPGADTPVFGPSRRLDYELELGIWVGPGNAPGEPIDIARAADHIAGFSLLNDWSARDIQAWEYQPLGPFLAKSFATTISPWIVTPEALAPFRTSQTARPDGDPSPLPYLTGGSSEAGLDLDLEAWLVTDAMRRAGTAPHRIARSSARHLYWTPAQLVTHHASGGCDLRPGDLLGTGTISGPGREEAGSLLEATLGGKEPLRLPSGETRTFLEDGDEVVLTARTSRPGFASIGFGTCRATIEPAR